MKLFLTTSWLVVALVFGIGAMHGCEDGEIAREKTVDVDDDQVTTQERTVRETDEGIIIEKKTTEKEYDDGRVQTETRTEREVVPKPEN